MSNQGMSWVLAQCKVGDCVRMVLDDRSTVQTLHVNRQGAEVNFHNTPLVIVGLDSDGVELVPLNSNLPVDVSIKVPERSKCLFNLVLHKYYVERYSKRWKQIEKCYTEVANWGK